MRAFEKHQRNARPGYFYYGKTVLVPPQHLVYAEAPPGSEEDGGDEEDAGVCFVRVETRDPATIMRCWWWDKK